jgi:hypothetical protein
MAKIIKKVLRYIILTGGILAILLGSLFLVLQMPDVQTYIVGKVTGKISREFNSTIQVGRVEYEFFNRLILSDVLIKDQNNDTLIYSEKLITGIRNYSRKESSFQFGKIYLIKPVVSLITDTSGLLNLDWYLGKLKGDTTSVSGKSSSITAEQIDIQNARFSIIDRRGTKGKTDIDFKNLKINISDGTIESLKIQNDTTSFSVFNLALKESSGFTIKKFNSGLKITKGKLAFKDTFLNCDSSIIDIPELSLTGDSTGSFSDFLNKVKIRAIVNNSMLNSSDLRYFIPLVRDFNESLFLSGKISGTIAELRGRNIHISYRDYTSLDCDFDFSGLPDLSNAFIYLGVNKFRTNPGDIEKIVLPGDRKIDMPKVLYKLGDISFEGSFTGFTTDFVAYGEFSSENGNITTDLSLRPEGRKNYKIKGLLAGNDINLGEIIDNRDLLGKVAIHANVDGYASSMKKFAVNLSGRLDSIEIKQYIYRNIALNGMFTDKTWDGSINVNDKNIKMDVLGLFNFEQKLPEFDFTLNISNAKLNKLNFDKSDTTSSVTLLLTSNFKGSNVDNLDGEIRLINSNFVRHGENLELYDFSLKTSQADNKPLLRLKTDFLEADITGIHNFGEFGNLVNYSLAKLMPSRFKSSLKASDVKKNYFSFRVNFKNTDEINKFLGTGFLVSENSFMQGDIYPDSLMRITGNSKELSVFNNVFSDFLLSTDLRGNELNFSIKSSSLELLRQSKLSDLNISFKTVPDNFIFNVNWGEKEIYSNSGNFIARGSLISKSDKQQNPLLKIDIDSSDVYARNNLWKINKSTIIIDSSAVNIDRFHVGNRDYFYSVDGSVSGDPYDTLNLGFKGIDITPVNYLIAPKRKNDPDVFSPEIKGILEGKIFLSNIYHEMLLVGDLTIKKLEVLGTDYGTLDIKSGFDINSKVINIRSENNFNGEKNLDINGYYNPASRLLNLTCLTNKLSLKPLNPLLQSFASDITGVATGKIILTSKPGSIVLNGAVLADNSTIKIDYLQTRYKMTDSVRFDRKGINFNNVKLTDERGNNAVLNGTVYHRNFKEITANLSVGFTDCMVLNTRPKDNDLFYGTTFATGVTTIRSSKDGTLSFDISAKSGRNTRFYIPLNTALSVSDVSFVSFADNNSKTNDSLTTAIRMTPVTPKTTGMDINMDLQVTPAAEVQLIFDMTVGDVMKANGSGDLHLSLDKKGDFRITGDYVIDHGDYLFTLQNILNKPFSVENGGRIIFNGDINNAEIDLKAIYKLRANPADIMPDAVSNEKIPVECQINLSGKLFNPKIAFDIYLPTADEKTRTYLRNAVATEEQLSRQFLYLLVMNSFYPDPAMGAPTPGNTGTAGTAAAVTTSEMLFSQLSNMLSKISNDFDIGVVYRPGTANSDINPDQLEVALSKQILNDKVAINGNFDVRGANVDPNTNQITGDFDAEVKITERVRFKVFNRYNNPYTGKPPNTYTQGVGVFFRQDFNKLSDLFGRKEKQDIKKEEETRIRTDK